MQTETNYKLLKAMILDHYLRQKSLLQKYADFNSITQTPNLNVKQLARKIKSAAKIYLDHNDSQSPQERLLVNKLLLFCDALRSDIRWELRKFNPSNLEEAIQKAQLIEEANNEKAASVNHMQVENQNLQVLELLEVQAKCQEQKFNEIKAEINIIKSTSVHQSQNQEQIFLSPFCYF